MSLDCVTEFYAANMRGSLFSGFLTLTGFLFSMKSFLLANLNRDIYGTADYQLWIEQVGKQYNPSLRVSSQMRNLSSLLLWTMTATFTASISQLTLGLVPSIFAVILCVIAAVVAVCFVGRSIFVLSLVVTDWMNYIDHQADERKKQSEQSAKNATV